MKRACLAVAVLLCGCPEVTSLDTDPTSCEFFLSKPIPELTLSENAVAWHVHPVKIPDASTASLTFTLVNASDADCPVAIYRDSVEPVLFNAPELSAEEPPPSQVTTIGQLMDDRIVPRAYDGEPGQWFVEIPLDVTEERSAYLTVLGCEGLAIGGQANVNYDCADAVRVSEVK